MFELKFNKERNVAVVDEDLGFKGDDGEVPEEEGKDIGTD